MNNNQDIPENHEPKVTTYNKAVRDFIPTIISSNPNIIVRHMSVSDQVFKDYLIAKLYEEVKEYEESKSFEELIDILEVTYALTNLHNLTNDTIEALRHSKNQKKGNFKNNFILLDTTENP